MKTLYPLTQIGFILITIVYMYFFVRILAGGAKRAGFYPSRRRSLIIGLTVGTIAWLAFISVLAYHQFFSDFQSLPPKFAIVVFVPLIIILYLAFTRTALEIVSNIDPTRIVVLQTFRVFV
jgi:glycopeptide antibiotics resistance protein